jgi:hypothetical protein
MGYLLLCFNHTINLVNRMTQETDTHIMTTDFSSLNSPSESHKRLQALIGTWKTTGRSWPDGFDKEPQMDSGKAVIKWINGERFMMIEVSGTQFGQPFSAISLIGFDNVRQRYSSVWTDNSSTSMFVTHGHYNRADNSIVLVGSSDNPLTDQFDVPWKVTLQIASNGFVLRYYDVTTNSLFFQLEFGR